MEMIADILLGAGAVGAAIYCLVLSRRLKAFNQLETGMGGAIAVLSAQVDDMTRALEAARTAAGNSADALRQLTLRAETASAKLEISLATLHDLPDHASGAPQRHRVLRRRARPGEQPEQIQ